jgi:hypothetical protein
MDLYPTVSVPVDQANEIVPTAQGALTVIPIRIVPNSVTQFSVTQTSTAQDYTLRIWISQQRDGLPIGDTWYASRVPDRIHAYYTPDQSPPDGTVPVLLVAGDYFINILNLTLQPNAFKFALI